MALKTITVLIPDSLEELTPLQLGTLCEQAKGLKKFFETIDAFVRAKLEGGQPVPGWEMGPGRNSREWKSEAVAIAAMAAQGINDPYERTLLSVAKAEKKVSNPEALKDAWTTVPGAPTLKPAAVSASLAADAKPLAYGF